MSAPSTPRPDADAGPPASAASAAAEQPHRRHNPLTGEWVLVSPHRTQRPWQGQRDNPADAPRPRHDPKCYLCPRNERAGGHQNPDYQESFVFTNDFAALLPEPPADAPGGAGDTSAGPADAPETLFQAQAVRGTCRVLCFSPRHDLTVAEMEPGQIRPIVDLWAAQIDELGRQYRWVQVFENKGAQMGASSPHPHGQLWATDYLPELPSREDARQRAYHDTHGRPLLCDYAARESQLGERVVVENDDWVAVVPYWAIWPFETMLLPHRHVARLPDLTDGERDALAAILRQLLVKYDNLFTTRFPYSMGWHSAPYRPASGAPGDGPETRPEASVDESRYWQLHAHITPPLLRSASVRKFMVGYELLAEAQRDLTAEAAADRLRALSDIHYRSAERR